MLQIALLIEFCQFAQALLHSLPGGDSFSRGLLGCFGNIVAGGLAFLPAVTHIQMRTMLGSIALTMAARSSAGAVGFRERSKDSDLGQTFDLSQQLRRWAVPSTDLVMLPPTLLIASDGK